MESPGSGFPLSACGTFDRRPREKSKLSFTVWACSQVATTVCACIPCLSTQMSQQWTTRLCTTLAFVIGTASVQPVPTGPGCSRSSSLRCRRDDELGRSLHVLQLCSERMLKAVNAVIATISGSASFCMWTGRPRFLGLPNRVQSPGGTKYIGCKPSFCWANGEVATVHL